jgi:glycerophosphoryl diester phosphodiesterase
MGTGSRIEIIGHRGAMGVEPENTLRSFRRAERDGAHALELDVRLSADGRLVVMHDAAVDRTTDGSGELAGMTLAELKRLDAGGGARVPAFAEVLEAVSLPIQTEVKAVEAFPVLARLVRERPELTGGRIIVSSFHREVLVAARAALPEVPRGLILHRAEEDMVDQARELGADWICPGMDGLTREAVQKCREAGLRVDAWPGNSPEAVRRAVEVGADAVTTNYPGEVGGWLTGEAG